MTKTRKKSDFPTKVCPMCGRPFAWRKRWAHNWDAIIYCSERCRRQRTPPPTATDDNHQ